MLNFQSHCNLFQHEFLDNFWLFVILIYDNHNKISKLGLFAPFCFWPLLASFRGHWKTFMWKLIQKRLVGRFEGIIKDFQHTWNEFKVSNSFWVIPLSWNFYLHQDFWPQQRLYSGWAKTFGPDMMQWGLNITNMKFDVFLGVFLALY